MICKKVKLSENNPRVELTTYVIDPSLEMIGGIVRPAVLILGGGAYFSVSDAEGEPVAMAFNAMGYHAFVLKYSTYGADAFIKGFDNMERRRMTEHPEPVRDVARAVSLIKEHASEWGVDPDKVIIGGFSAGAHNAAMYLTNWNKPLIKGYLNKSEDLLRPAAGILGYPVTDYIFMKKAIKEGMADEVFHIASNMAFVGAKEPSEQLLDEISPARNIDKDTPPCFIWTTAADNMVPAQNSLLMALALANAKIPYELHVFERGDHGLSVANQLSAAGQNQMNADVHKWVGLAEDWLKKRFAISLPEAVSFEDADAAIAQAMKD